jgi:hypothetical protein
MSPLVMLTLILFAGSLLAVLLIWSLFAPRRPAAPGSAPKRPNLVQTERSAIPPTREPTPAGGREFGRPPPMYAKEALSERRAAAAPTPPKAVIATPSPPEMYTRPPSETAKKRLAPPAVAPKATEEKPAENPFERFERSLRD